MRALQLLAIVLIVLTSRVFAQEAEIAQILTFEYDGLARHYHLTVPDDYDPDEPVPLLVALHPIFSSGRAFQALTGLDESSYIVAYPQSYHPYWNDGRMDVGLSMVYEPLVDDLGFLTALIDHLQSEYNTSELYLTGMNNGGLMAMVLACSMPERVEAVATAAALLWDYVAAKCSEQTPAPFNLLMFHGLLDKYFESDGGAASGQDFRRFGRDETLDFWSERNGCTRLAMDYFVARYECVDGTTTAMYMLDRAGHNWLRIGDYKLNNFGVDMTERILAFFAGDESWANEPADAEIPRAGRSYHAYVPTSYDPAGTELLPLVIVLHGNPSNGVSMAFISEFHRVAEEEGFIVVYPDSINPTGWASGGSFTTEDLPNRLNDTMFLFNMVDDLSQFLRIDPARQYVTGFSNGGYMTERLACVGSDRFAAFAFVGASVFDDLLELCTDRPPVPMLIMHGTNDVSISWDGYVRDINGQTVGRTYTVPETMGFWLYKNQCVNEYEDVELPQEGNSPETAVRIFHYTNCGPGSEVKFYGIVGGGHNWPGVQGVIREAVAGNVNMDIHASEEIWAFFSQFTLSDQPE